MLEWYRHIPERIDPVFFERNFFVVYWYSIGYASALCVGAFVLYRQTRTFLSFDRYADLLFNILLGVLVGSRLGYVLLYNASWYAKYPLSVIWPFDPITNAWIGIAGMSYYGGLTGVVFAIALFARQHRQSFWSIADVVAMAVPIGYFFGRIGNFVNGELYGRVTDAISGMYIADISGNVLLRHPSQLYEAFLEGPILFFILTLLRKRFRFSGAIASAYCLLYGGFRFFAEFFREPDYQSGLVLFDTLTLGQVFSSAIFFIGVFLFWRRRKNVLQ